MRGKFVIWNKMANLIGNSSDFAFKMHGGEQFESYYERIELFFAANNVEDAGKKKATFLTLCGPELYQLIRSLVAPEKPVDKTLKEIVDLINGHLNPKPNVIVERYKFNMRTRKTGESIADFLADLRYLSRNCEFKAGTDEMIRDRLVCGVGDLPIQRKLLGEAELDLKKATKIALGMETANKEAVNLGGTREIHGVDQMRKREACFRCGDVKHRAPDCVFKDREFCM